MVWNTVAAFSGADNCAAILYDFGRSRHAFDGLIEILIQRVARIRSDHDIEQLVHTAHGVLTRTLTRGGVFLKQVTAESGRDLLIAVQCNVEGKIHSR